MKRFSSKIRLSKKVHITSSFPPKPGPSIFRWVLEMTPCVTELLKNNGLPTAMTNSPGRAFLLSASLIVGRFFWERPKLHPARLNNRQPEIYRLDPHGGQIGDGVVVLDRAFELLAAVQGDPHLVRAVHHVRVGQDQPVAFHNEAGSAALHIHVAVECGRPETWVNHLYRVLIWPQASIANTNELCTSIDTTPGATCSTISAIKLEMCLLDFGLSEEEVTPIDGLCCNCFAEFSQPLHFPKRYNFQYFSSMNESVFFRESMVEKVRYRSHCSER